MNMIDRDYPEEYDSQDNSILAILGDFLSKPINIALIAFIVGTVFGWMVLGWGLFPIEWQNASYQEVRPDLQIDYLRMVVDSYNLRNDWPLAQQRINALGEDAPILLQALYQNPGDELSQATLDLFMQVYGSDGGQTTPVSTGEENTSLSPDNGDSKTGSYLLIACVVTFALGGILVAMYFFRGGRRRGPVEHSTAMRAQEMTRQTEQTDYEALGEDRPVAQYMTTYLIGDDLFDDSFSIDSPSGEFMGECGVGIADTIGVGEPKRVSAFEVWLFDKNDIKTITKVLMSQHIYNDETGLNRLAAKGEPILVQPNAETVLQTETLEMAVRVVEMEYGSNALPDKSFFERMTLELAIWSNR
ncbi:MAG: hypothetical protein PVF83_10555 [Anaerolineales bacterium]|jgi:hypothetical protein